MENTEQKTLMKELSQGKELARQLMKHLQEEPSSQEEKDSLVAEILSSYEKALSILNQANHKGMESPQHYSSGNASPRSVFFDQETTAPRQALKKRKTVMPKSSEKVKVCLVAGIEGTLEDGHSWRKYGQKDILGSIHPRGYYRCTHRNTQGCLATKQVQKSDKDTSLVEVTYKGRHTCYTSQPSKHCLLEDNPNSIPMQPKPQQALSALSNLKAGLEVKTEASRDNLAFPPFSFPTENPFLPGTSHDHFPTFGCSDGSDSDLTDIISTPSSVSNLHLCDFDFIIENVDFDAEFPLDSPGFFS